MIKKVFGILNISEAVALALAKCVIEANLVTTLVLGNKNQPTRGP